MAGIQLSGEINPSTGNGEVGEEEWGWGDGSAPRALWVKYKA